MKMKMTTINGKPVLMTKAQALELERDGMVIVGDRIIRSGAYVARVHGKVGESIAATAKRVFK